MRTISKAFATEVTKRLRAMAAQPNRTHHPDAPALARSALRLIAALKEGQKIRGRDKEAIASQSPVEPRT